MASASSARAWARAVSPRRKYMNAAAARASPLTAVASMTPSRSRAVSIRAISSP